ncbi:hypothetical protein PDESU_05028 [Pontiella desulfatans]|uniref:Uncharacterized protein n=1 Tax=Pontiella desulfatans TaxID=2750659 RepID=A0A6C2U9N6_PONDE|nr:hypothetical protein [Pontiella desulfatans]VGO16437.1 hypothetical protein PDESU_05028 [Pontiella desulfatans]
MKRGIIALLCAVLLAGVGAAHGQVFVYDSENNDYVTANKDFSATPTSWQNYESAPASDYTGPSFSYAGVNSDSVQLNQARLLANDRLQMNDNTNFHYMVAFDFPASAVKTITTQGSTFGVGVAGDDTYLILHDSTQGPADGWYATLLHSRTTVSTFEYTVEVADATWYAFTPSTVNGTVPLGTIGSVVDVSIITGGTFDEAGYYADVYDNNAGAINHYLWSLVVYEPSADASLELGELLPLYVEDASGVVTGTVAVSYVEGIPATNVTISAVSVVDQTHPGAFANITALPLNLIAPAPATEDVSIEFDNSTAGLSNGQTATGVVQIIWNEVGSASSSTSSVPVSATRLAINQGNTIAIFDHTGSTANPALQGLVTRISNGYGTVTGQGSTDGSYGTLPGDARTDGGCYRVSLTYPVVSVAITNETGFDCTFDSLHFDAAKQYAKGLKKVEVSISGDVTSGPLFTNTVDLTQFAGTVGDYDDFDIDLTGLADRTLAHGESALIEFTFFDGDPSNSNAVSCIDNIALLGSGSNGAGLTRVPGGWISMDISGLDLGSSQLIEMFYTEGDSATNIVITGVSFADETHPGSFSFSGSLPVELATAETTNTIVTLVFDNTVANVAAGTSASAVMELTWNEKGLPSRVFEINVYAWRPADVPSTTNVIALLDTEFLTADAAVNGVKAVMSGAGSLQYNERGSEDGTYGSISSNVLVAPVTTSMWQLNNINNSAMLTFTNTTVADTVLSSLHFDIGRWYAASADGFTLSVSGDVTADPALLYSSLTVLGFQNYDFDDHDVDLTGLADHTLAAGEFVTFTVTLDPKPESPFNNTWIDNVALLGTFDVFGGWANDEGLTKGVNDGPYDNPDGDGKDNFMEFATGGDPLVADGAAAAMWQAEDGGTNWLYHVHGQRQDDASLTYGVGTKENLQYDPSWDSGDVEQVGALTGPGLWKTITNRTDTGATAKFIGLEVQQN